MRNAYAAVFAILAPSIYTLHLGLHRTHTDQYTSITGHTYLGASFTNSTQCACGEPRAWNSTHSQQFHLEALQLTSIQKALSLY